MKCLVSGATGFIGRQLCQQLVARGDTVIALSKYGAPLSSGEPSLALDLAVSDPDDELLRGVDVVFHLAGIARRQERESASRARQSDDWREWAAEQLPRGWQLCFLAWPTQDGVPRDARVPASAE